MRSSAHPDWMGGGAAGRSSTGLCRVGFALRELARKLLWSELSDARGGICVCVYRTEGKTAAWMDETHLCKEFSILQRSYLSRHWARDWRALTNTRERILHSLRRQVHHVRKKTKINAGFKRMKRACHCPEHLMRAISDDRPTCACARARRFGTPRCGARRAALRNEARVLLGAAALPVERARPAAI